MNVFSKVTNFFYRHRNKFIISAAVISGTILATKYAQQKLRNWQEIQTKEFLDRTRKQQHFESTQRTCNQTFMSLSSSLTEPLSRLQDTQGLILKLQQNPENRVELWERLKICVFTKMCTVIYTYVMLIVILRIQLNLVGGYLYKDTKSVSNSLQEKYLSMCQLFLDRGFLKITSIIEERVADVLNPVDLKTPLTLYEIENLFTTIQIKMCENRIDPLSHLREYVIPEEIQESNNLYDNMVRETADLLESEEVQSIAGQCISNSFSCIIDKLADFFTPNGAIAVPSTSAGTFTHPSNVHIPMAKIIPILNGLLNRNSFPEALVEQLINNQKLKILGANVYEVFSATTDM